MHLSNGSRPFVKGLVQVARQTRVAGAWRLLMLVSEDCTMVAGHARALFLHVNGTFWQDPESGWSDKPTGALPSRSRTTAAACAVR